VFVAILMFVCVVVLFLFRSYSYPVPQRGERVKQRTVHTENLCHCYSYFHTLHLCEIVLSITGVRLCFDCLLHVFGLVW
jgi:hypothetical protein